MKQEIDFFNIRPEDKIPQKGRMLISEPFLPDTFFNRTLVYLTEHNEKGSVGFIINKLINLRVNDALEGFPVWDEKMAMGGPVAPDTLHYLHTMGDIVPDSVWVSDNIFWGGNIEVIKELINSSRAGSDDIRFFLGYSGWGVGQLEKELKENSWVIADVAPEVVMRYRKEDSWKTVLRSLNKKYSLWAEFPDSPEMN
ncbi:MAG: YqgE/AlgH family protein [Bacteroidales bacterium]|jgi:putative transcriptional regulator|nr:YqgE/AlgH family protein [Bacteroidales bacterium]